MNNKLKMLQDSFAHLSALEDQRRVLMATLQMWGEIVVQGIDADDVVAIGHSMEFVKREPFGKERWRLGKKEEPTANWYNYVRLKDGTKKQLDPPVKPAPKQAVPSEI